MVIGSLAGNIENGLLYSILFLFLILFGEKNELIEQEKNEFMFTKKQAVLDNSSRIVIFLMFLAMFVCAMFNMQIPLFLTCGCITIGISSIIVQVYLFNCIKRFKS